MALTSLSQRTTLRSIYLCNFYFYILHFVFVSCTIVFYVNLYLQFLGRFDLNPIVIYDNYLCAKQTYHMFISVWTLHQFENTEVFYRYFANFMNM